ncbi:MAG: acyltransferase [Chloroflexi bacterium]|nr:acyltransferase [Chloroflexota bacterium]
MKVERPTDKLEASRTASSGGGDRILVLDGVRGIAIAMVMVYHFNFLYHLHFTAADASLPLLDELVSKTLGAGWAGVDLFFVLSGFLITGILYDAKGPARRFFGSFYARRVLRIFPAYYGFLGLMLIALPLLNEFDAPRAIVSALPWYGGYLTNIERAINPSIRPDLFFVGHIWSLAIEEQFYLVWPAFVFLFSRRTLLWVCAAGVVCALVLRVSFAVADMPQPFSYTLTPSRMDTLAIGAFIALAARSAGGLSTLRSYAPSIAAVSGAVVVLLGVLNDGFSPLDTWVLTMGFTAVALLFGAGLVLSIELAAASWPHRLLSHPLVRWLGRYSYAAYLLHPPVALLLARKADVFGDTPELFGSTLPGELVFAIVAAAVTLGLAWLSWWLWESRFLKLKRHFPYGGSAGGRAPASAAPAPTA